MEKCLLVVATAALLSASLMPHPAHSMPLSWGKSSRYQRSLKTESAITDPPPTMGTGTAGRVHQTALDAGPGQGRNGGADNATEDPLSRCMEKCYGKRVPAADIDRLKGIAFREFMTQGVHPGFLVSEWLENYHRVKFCSSRNYSVEWEHIRCEDVEQQSVHDIKEKINSTMSRSDRVGHEYRVHYDENSYPRYLVDVVCGSDYAPVLKDMKHLKRNTSNGKWEVYLRATAVQCVYRGE